MHGLQDAASERRRSQAGRVHATTALRAKPASASRGCFGAKADDAAPEGDSDDIISFTAVDLSAFIPTAATTALETQSSTLAPYIPPGRDSAMLRADPIHTAATTATQVRIPCTAS